MKRFWLALFICTASCLFPGMVFSADFGLLIDQKIESEQKDSFSYTPGFTPWLSWNGGRGMSVYLSGLLSMKYNRYGGNMEGLSGWVKPLPVPELSRFALNCRINPGLAFEAGRVRYADVLRFAASGLFDGLRFEALIPVGSLSIGAFYTGLLYKETAKIVMTAEDSLHFAKPWDWDNFGDYFASRRALASARWDMPVGESGTLSAELLAQFDLNDAESKRHSQYLGVQLEFYPLSMLRVALGGVFEAQENSDWDFGASFGAAARARMDVPGVASDWLGVTAQFTSGSWNDYLILFSPINAVPQGAVFTGTNAGLALVGADYSVRIIKSLFAEAALRYFMRTYTEIAADGNLYGGELWATLAWQPLEDLRATLGGGVFFPGLGNVYPSGTDVMWKISAAVVLSL